MRCKHQETARQKLSEKRADARPSRLHLFLILAPRVHVTTLAVLDRGGKDHTLTGVEIQVERLLTSWVFEQQGHSGNPELLTFWFQRNTILSHLNH